MKKHQNRLLSLLLCLVVLLSLLPAAAAEEAAQTAEEAAQTDDDTAQPVESSDGLTAAERGLKAIEATGWADVLVLPDEDSYLDEWKTLYARKAFKAPCLRVERISEIHTGRLIMPYLYEGTTVTVVAEQNDMSCIIYRGSDNNLYAGWIQSIRLLEDFPGETVTLGTAPEAEPEVRNDITVSWSKCRWLTTQQNYSVLSEEVKNCVGFTLEYQLIETNTTVWSSVYGPRKIYVKSGDEWTEVGEFEYPEMTGAVRIQVYLDEPMDINGIGTIAQCSQPDIFWFRQTVTDFLIAES